MSQHTIQELEKLIEDVPDFPIQGVTFKDISPLLAQAFTPTIDALAALLSDDQWAQIDVIGGVDARGFVFASALAHKLEKGLVMIRKDGKLPPPVSSCDYSLEYGTATLEMKSGDGRMLIVDDVLATGGTLKAAASLSEKAGYDLVGFLTLIDLAFLNDFSQNSTPLKALFTYD